MWPYFKVIFDYLKYQSLHPFLHSLRLIPAYFFFNICQNKIKLQCFQKDHYTSKSTRLLKNDVFLDRPTARKKEKKNPP